MPKDKMVPKQKPNKKSRFKPATKSKTRPKSKSKDGPLVDELINLPDDNEIKRGPLLRVKFPKFNEDDDAPDDDPIEVPQSMEELRRLYKPYPKMQVFDPDTGEEYFGGIVQVKDYIQIRAGEVGGKSVEDTEQWFGQIMYIGARKPLNVQGSQTKEEDQDVCIRVAWFYDYGMLDQRPITPEDKKLCSNMIKNELIYSDHYDTIHLSSVQGRVDIPFFNETTTSQDPIAYGDRFYRRVLSRDHIICFKPTCTTRCKLTYHPERDVQHFCPRASCRRWYHTTCLVPNKSRAEDYRILEYDRQRSSEEQLMELISAFNTEERTAQKPVLKPKVKQKFGDIGASSETESDTTHASPDPPSPAVQRRLVLLRELPGQIRQLAASAIMRGLQSGQGIVGGGWVINRARFLARKVVVEGGVLTDEEEQELAQAAETANPGEELKLAPPKYLCPGCGQPI